MKSAGVDSPYNYIDPVRRDVVSTGDVGSNVTIRFQTDNSGPWILHWYGRFPESRIFEVADVASMP